MLIDLYEKETDPEKKELLKFEWGMDFGAPHETEHHPDATTSRSSSTAIPPRSRRSTWNPGPDVRRSASRWTCSRRKVTARSAAARSASATTTLLLAAHPQGGTARRSLQVVPGAAQVRLGPAFGLRHGRGAGHRLDVRHRAHPRGDPLPADDQARLSVGAGGHALEETKRNEWGLGNSRLVDWGIGKGW